MTNASRCPAARLNNFVSQLSRKSGRRGNTWRRNGTGRVRKIENTKRQGGRKRTRLAQDRTILDYGPGTRPIREKKLSRVWREREVHTAREIRLEHLFSWLQLSHLAAIVCRSAQNSAPTVRIRGHKARADACAYRARLVLYQLATNTAIPDDKAERVAGVRGQPGPVAGVQPISDWQPAGHFARSTRTIVFCLRLLVRRTSMNCTSKSRDRPCSPTGCSEFLFASTDHRASRSIATVGVAFVGSTLLFVRVYDSHTWTWLFNFDRSTDLLTFSNVEDDSLRLCSPAWNQQPDALVGAQKRSQRGEVSRVQQIRS